MGVNMNSTFASSLSHYLILDDGDSVDNSSTKNIWALYAEVVKRASDEVEKILGMLSDVEKMKFFKSSGPGGFPLNYSVKLGDINVTEALLKGLEGLGEDEKMEVLKQKALVDGSSLHFAVQKSHPEMVKKLLGAAPIDRAIELIGQANDDGATPLWLALRDGRAKIVASLIHKNWVSNVQRVELLRLSGPDGSIPLHVALASGDGTPVKNLVHNIATESLVQLLLMEDLQGSQFLHIAASLGGRSDLIRTLFGGMSNENSIRCFNQVRRLDGKTPLLLAVEKADVNFVSELFGYFRKTSSKLPDLQAQVMSFQKGLGVAVNKSSDEMKSLFRNLCGNDLQKMMQLLGVEIERPEGKGFEDLERSQRREKLSAIAMESPDQHNRPLAIVSLSTAPMRAIRSKAYINDQTPRASTEQPPHPLSQQNAQSGLRDKNPSIQVRKPLIKKPQMMPAAPLSLLQPTLGTSTSQVSPLRKTAQLMPQVDKSSMDLSVSVKRQLPAAPPSAQLPQSKVASAHAVQDGDTVERRDAPPPSAQRSVHEQEMVQLAPLRNNEDD